MTQQSERNYPGDVVQFLVDYAYCVETVTVKQDANATEGLVVGELLEPDSTKKVVVATGASCDSVLLEKVDLADLVAGDTKRAALVRGPAIINSTQVNVASAQKAAALTALAALGIISRAEPTFTTQTT